MDQADIPALLAQLSSEEDAVRKMAVFRLQSSINDPAFADVFIASGGLLNLRRLIMGTGGNTLAYSLQSLARLLEVDMGWYIFEGPHAADLVERVVELIVTNPLVNILRGAMSILVALVGHSQSTVRGAHVPVPGTFGLRALKPAVAVHPQFFELVIQQLRSADHALCANALMLINALVRDAVSGEAAPPATATTTTMMAKGGPVSLEEWPKFIKRLQDLGLIKAIYSMMQSPSLQDLVHPLLEFQSLTKVLLRKWREVRVDTERPEHRRGLKAIHLASAPVKVTTATTDAAPGSSKRHSPEKWRRLGFETESPAHDFDTAGFLGMMDLTDYVRKNEDGYQKLLLEQSARPLHERCPVARVSLAVTMVLYEHFDVEASSDLEDATKGGYQGLDGAKNLDKLFRPLLLQWARLHTAGLHAFFRIWNSTGAVLDDFEKVVALVRILFGQVVGRASRTKDVLEVEEELQEFDVSRLRALQMELLELNFEGRWGQHLYQVRDELRQEALQFVREQRIRCLLQGSWFTTPTPTPPRDRQGPSYSASASVGDDGVAKNHRVYAPPTPWRYAKLSPNRRHLYYADFEERPELEPTLDSLTSKIDLSTISSVVSSVSAAGDDTRSANSSRTTLKLPTGQPPAAHHPANTKITIYSYGQPKPQQQQQQQRQQRQQQQQQQQQQKQEEEEQEQEQEPKEEPVLTLFPHAHSLASEWLDGLLMLLNQAPITAETGKLVSLVREYGLKIRLLNVRLETAYAGPPPGAGVVPSREGLDEDYFYEI